MSSLHTPAAAAQQVAPPLLELKNVHRHYRLPRTHLWKPPAVIHAVRGISLRIEAGKSYGLVGESGSGKSTLARLAMALEAPDQGSVALMGQDLNAMGVEALRAARKDFQMVFQDPYGSLDPRQSVQRIVTEPLQALGSASALGHGSGSGAGADDWRKAALDALLSVGLRASDLDKYPHEFSGGQRQRIAIARALITRPKLIVADEPVSALDVSVQAQVLNLMQDLQRDFGVTYLLISHDLAVVNHLCDQVGVIHQGLIVEEGPPEQIFLAPQQEYTKRLIAAVPDMQPTK
jgi:ABC-type glutathione transport system ATPase component